MKLVKSILMSHWFDFMIIQGSLFIGMMTLAVLLFCAGIYTGVWNAVAVGIGVALLDIIFFVNEIEVESMTEELKELKYTES